MSGEPPDAAPWQETKLMPDSRPRAGRRDATANDSPLIAGDLLCLDRRASVQFFRPITVRVIREIEDRQPYDGWAWIEAYELNARGTAVAKRELFVYLAGLRRLESTTRERMSSSSRTYAATRLRGLG